MLSRGLAMSHACHRRPVRPSPLLSFVCQSDRKWTAVVGTLYDAIPISLILTNRLVTFTAVLERHADTTSYIWNYSCTYLSLYGTSFFFLFLVLFFLYGGRAVHGTRSFNRDCCARSFPAQPCPIIFREFSVHFPRIGR